MDNMVLSSGSNEALQAAMVAYGKKGKVRHRVRHVGREEEDRSRHLRRRREPQALQRSCNHGRDPCPLLVIGILVQ